MVVTLKSSTPNSSPAHSYYDAAIPDLKGRLTVEPSEISIDYDFYQAVVGDVKSLFNDSETIEHSQSTQEPAFKPVAALDLDDDWIEIELKSTGEPAYYRKLESKENPESTITFYYSGKTISEPSARIFNLLLKIRDHTLAHFEFEGLHEVMRNKNIEDSFVLQFAQTATIEGKRVLIVEGKNTEQNHKVISIYINADGEGSKVQEIHLQCPINNIALVRKVKTAFDTIQWTE